MMYRAALVDPNAPVEYGVAPGIQYTGLALVRGVVGQPVVVEFTATALYASSPIGPALLDQQDYFTGAVVNASNVIVATFNPFLISVGLIGSTQLRPSEYMSVTLTSRENLTGPSVGQTYTAYMGPASVFSGYSVGDALAPDSSTMLSVAFTVPGSGQPSTGGNPGGTGGFTPPPANQSGSTPLNPGNILVWVEQHWQIVVVGGLGLLLAPTIINAFASTTVAENRLKAARRGAA